jgi:hypothetical protein
MSKMHFVGPVLAYGDDMLGGMLSDGRQIFVDEGTYLGAPKSLRRKPDYWYRRWATGEFEDPEDCPCVYVRKVDHAYPAHERQYDLPPVSREQAYATYLEARRRSFRWDGDWPARRPLWKAWQRRCEPAKAQREEAIRGLAQKRHTSLLSE